MNKNEFIKTLEKEDIHVTEMQMEQFEKYKSLLLEWNEKMNLTSITEEEEIWQKHFYDSVYPFLHLDFSNLCDVGSGAGFPGIPVKILFPNIELNMVEPLKKRCTFLKEVVRQLGLEKVNVYDQRAEDFAKDYRESFEVVSARAVARLTILLELCAPLVQKNGTMVALKGKNGKEELENAQLAIETLGLQMEKEELFESEEATRVNFYFKKVKNSPKKYPRAYGQIKKKPLGE
ncbi:MAG: 16S rRNA (guanine(527)-N(7))-methyltransferase RsmG [Bacillota bacterium]|nr:16S rRNA (guanine(527)-N(7))-methyltransferase RsmG [Bacillota bacterium]